MYITVSHLKPKERSKWPPSPRTSTVFWSQAALWSILYDLFLSRLPAFFLGICVFHASEISVDDFQDLRENRGLLTSKSHSPFFKKKKSYCYLQSSSSGRSTPFHLRNIVFNCETQGLFGVFIRLKHLLGRGRVLHLSRYLLQAYTNSWEHMNNQLTQIYRKVGQGFTATVIWRKRSSVL